MQLAFPRSSECLIERRLECQVLRSNRRGRGERILRGYFSPRCRFRRRLGFIARICQPASVARRKGRVSMGKQHPRIDGLACAVYTIMHQMSRRTDKAAYQVLVGFFLRQVGNEDRRAQILRYCSRTGLQGSHLPARGQKECKTSRNDEGKRMCAAHSTSVYVVDKSNIKLPQTHPLQ